MLEFVDEGIGDKVSEPEASEIEVGMIVEDTASGFKGMVTSKVTHLNGCVYFDVVPKYNDKKLLEGVPPASYLSASRLKIVSRSADPDVPSTKTETFKATGGPSSRVPQNRVR